VTRTPAVLEAIRKLTLAGSAWLKTKGPDLIGMEGMESLREATYKGHQIAVGVAMVQVKDRVVGA
jgi:hypothetical protein